jgi:hypothetical protein
LEEWVEFDELALAKNVIEVDLHFLADVLIMPVLDSLNKLTIFVNCFNDSCVAMSQCLQILDPVA